MASVYEKHRETGQIMVLCFKKEDGLWLLTCEKYREKGCFMVVIYGKEDGLWSIATNLSFIYTNLNNLVFKFLLLFLLVFPNAKGNEMFLFLFP